MVYYCAGQTIAQVDASGNRTSSTYNVRGEQIASTRTPWSTTIFDGVGLAVATIDALGFRTTTIYDQANRPIASVNALGYRTTSVLDGAWRLIASVNALGAASDSTLHAIEPGVGQCEFAGIPHDHVL